ncbi:MAG: DUF1549 and DUF1553 domain-containing protein [Opitutales bacterium]|nr:DUF1549 and DUF1553 domain-containing protein [Opitutales bacterium]
MTLFVSYRWLFLLLGLVVVPLYGLKPEYPVLGKGFDHWAFKPVKRTAAPRVEGAPSSIDSFVRSKLSQGGLEPSPAASKAVLFRRLSFDLTGLPPSFEQIREFEKDEGPDAYERAVDKFLASPRFGERWGRYWLDLARYADTKGYLVGGSSRLYPFAYTYRDWVIRAFNEGIPYDEFVSKQLAADLMVDSPNHPDLAALGFLTVGPRLLNRRHLIIDDRIDVVTRGLMGFTVGCARCHDHFFDPIPQEDYYSIYGVFNLARQPKELPFIGQPDLSSGDYKEFEKKGKELEAVVKKHLQSNWDAVRSRDGLTAYLQLVHDGRELSDDRFEALAAKRKLFPKLARRWRAFFKVKARQKDRFFAVWRAFEKATPKKYPSTVKSLLKHDPSLPSFLLRGLRELNKNDFKEVIGWYASELATSLKKAESGAGSKGTISFVKSSAFPVGFTVEGVEEYFDTKARDHTNSLRAKLSKHKTEHPGSPPRAMALVDDSVLRNPRVFDRGNPSAPGRKVPRRFLAALSHGSERKPYEQGSGRLELAKSILHPDNPLTGRVFVNRVWMHLFGTGIVRTPSDFGLQGENPTHPLLLDHLTYSFINEGWDVKHLIRLITTSATYRQKSGVAPISDPENRLLSVMNRKRLDFEAMRDSMLAVSGELDLSMGGRAVHLTKKPFPVRRAVYGFVERQNLPSLFRTFDFANPNIHAPLRFETTVAPQALFALNDPFVITRAEKLGRLAQSSLSGDSWTKKTIEALNRFLFRRVVLREPSRKELESTLAFVGANPSPGKLADIAQSLLVSNEFFFID